MHATIRERRSEGGFTLIELLVVMIIIAILMAVAIPTFLAQKNSAQKTKVTANIKQVVNAIEACAANNTDGSVTPTDPTLTNCTNWPASSANATSAGLKSFEKGLVSLGAGPVTVIGQYQINAIGRQGYMVQGSIQDGDFAVTFAEIHYEDGGLKKVCQASAAGSATPVAFSVPAAGSAAPTGVAPGIAAPQTRTCVNGLWG